MANSRTHDRSISIATVPYALVAVWLTGNHGYGVVSAIAFLWSGLYLSPDLDIRSDPFKRWGLLKWYWLPYQKLIPHRSIWSHGPIIGSQLRVLYLAVPWCLVFTSMGFGDALASHLIHYSDLWLSAAIACEASALVHLFMDWIS